MRQEDKWMSLNSNASQSDTHSQPWCSWRAWLPWLPLEDNISLKQPKYNAHIIQ